MEFQELKVKKWKVWFDCAMGIFLLCIWSYVLFTLCAQFSINFSDPQKPFFTVQKEISPTTPRHRKAIWPESLDPFLLLLFFICSFLFILIRLKYYLILTNRGYVARMNAEGLLSANNQFIPWDTIKNIIAVEQKGRKQEKIVIELKKIPPKNTMEKFLTFFTGHKTGLRDFNVPLDEAYDLVTSYWKRYK